MGDKSSIEWTDATWTPFVGDPARDPQQRWYCQRISPGCDNCYASTLARRFGGRPYPAVGTEDGRDHVRLKDTALLAPLGWRKPRRIFLSSMTDIAGEWVPSEWLMHIWAIMALTPRHTYQVLTKRPQRLRQWFESEQGNPHAITSAMYEHAPAAQCEAVKTGAAGMIPWPLPNVWLGTSIELDRYVWRAKEIAEIPAAVRFVSAEPLLGPLPSLLPPALGRCPECGAARRWDLPRSGGLDSYCPRCGRRGTNDDLQPGVLGKLDWLIAGGESGPSARPVHPDWLRDLRDRTRASGVAFFFKQWGEWKPSYFGEGTEPWDSLRSYYFPAPHRPHKTWRFGKKLAGRLLDGDQWNEFPAVAPREVAHA